MAHSSRHAFEAHTGEVRLVAEAPSRAALFEEVGRAVAELMGPEDRPDRQAGESRAVELDARDDAALLVAWVDELVFLSETQHAVYWDVAVDAVAGGHLSARVRGTPVETLRTAVKAATFHDIEVAEVPHAGGPWRARVVLDV